MSQILFVDDQPELLTSMRHMLRRFRDQWDMHFAEGADAALEMLDRQPIDVIVSDMRMPGMDGAQLLQAVQERHPQVARILLSGYSDSESALRAVPVSHQYISKPCRPKELQNTVSRVVKAQAQLNNPTMAKIIGGMKKLPSPPALYHRLCMLISAGNVNQDQVAELISTDAAMAVRVLQLVNSAYFRSARSIDCIKEAVVLLGLDALSHLVLAAEVFGAADDSTNGVDVVRVRDHSLATAKLARAIAMPAYKSTAYLSALLHDVGMLVWSGLGELDATGVEMGDMEWQQSELHSALGAYLLGIWGLPYHCVEAARYHHRPLTVELGEFDELPATYVAHELVVAAEKGTDVDEEELKEFLEPFGLESKLAGWMGATDRIMVDVAA